MGANCAPDEIPVLLAERLGYAMWRDRHGNRVAPDTIATEPGLSHCDWEDVVFLYVSRDEKQTSASSVPT